MLRSAKTSLCTAFPCCLRDYLGEIPSLRSFCAKCPEIESGLGMRASLKASPQTSQEGPALWSGQV